MDIEIFKKNLPKKDLKRVEIYYGFLKNYHSVHTRIAYSHDLFEYFKFLQEQFPNLDEFEVKLAHIVAYREWIIEKGYVKRTVNRKVACLSAFYEHLYFENLIKENPVLRIKRFKINREIETNDLSDQDVLKIFNIIDTSSYSGLLHLALLSIYFHTGLRSSAVAGMKLKNIQNINGTLCFKYIEKGGIENIVPIPEFVKNCLGNYLEKCEKLEMNMGANEYIFRARKGRESVGPIRNNSLNYIIKTYAKKIGIEYKVSIHSARATVIGSLLEKGESLYNVSDFVNHKDVNLTAAYSKRKRRIQDNLSLKIGY